MARNQKVQDITNPNRDSRSLVGMYKEAARGLPDLARREYARQAASLSKAVNLESSELLTYQQALYSRDLKENNRSMLGAAISASRRRLTESARQSGLDGNMQDVDLARDEIKATEALQEDPFGAERMAAEIEAAPGSTRAEKELYALRTAQQEDLAEIIGGTSGWEVAWDAAKSFVPGVNQYRTSDFLENTPIIGAWGGEAELASMINKYQALPVERQRNLWPVLKSEVIDSFGDVEGASVLQKFLSPSGSEDLGEYSNLWVGLDIADVGLTSAGMALGIAGTLSRFNKIRRLGDLGATQKAGAASADAVADTSEAAADAAGIDRATAANNGTPDMTSAEGIDAATYAGANAHLQKRLDSIHKNLDSSVDRIIDESRVLRPEIDTTETVDGAIAKRQVEYAAEIEARGLELTNLVTKPIQGSSTRFRTTGQIYDRVNDSTESFTRKWELERDDYGDYRTPNNWNPAGQAHGRKFLLRGDPVAREEFERMLQAENLTGTMASQFSDQYIRANRLLKGPFKRSKRKKVDQIIMLSDEWQDADGVEVSRLIPVSELKHKYGLEDDQVEYYHAFHHLTKRLGQLKNSIERQKMEDRGIKNITSSEGGQVTNRYGKVYNSPSEANGAFLEDSTVKVLDKTDGSELDVDSLDLSELYDEGKAVVKLEDGRARSVNGADYDMVVVNTADVSDLPAQVINMKEFYVPRFYERGIYATSAIRRGTKNGKNTPEVLERKTFRIYDNVYERDRDLDNIKAEAEKAGYKAEDGWEVKPIDRGQSTELSPAESAEAFGGRMYTSARGSQPVPFGSNAEKAERLDPSESIRRQLSNVARDYPRHRLRAAMYDRLYKFAEANGINDFAINRPLDDVSTPARKHLENLRQNYMAFAGLKTMGESWSAAKAASFYETLVGTRGVRRDNPAVRLSWSLSQKNPLQAIRSANFHLMLGFWNPVQAFLQSQAALTGVSITPAGRMPNVVRGHIALATAQNVGDSSYMNRMMGKAMGGTEADGEALIKAYRRTGFDESIRQNADIQLSQASVGDPLAMMQRVMSNGTFPYNTGERINRRVSWLAAVERHMDRGNKKSYSQLSTKDWEQINNEANTLMYSMHSINKANWQEGLASIPTQFMQVQAKFIEELSNLENGLSTADRAGIMLGQLLMYGSKSIPFFSRDYIGGVSQALGFDEGEIYRPENEATYDFITGGFMKWAFHSMLGIDADVSGRFAVLEGLNNLGDAISGDASFRETMVGATLSTYERGLESVRNMAITFAGLAGEGRLNPLPYVVTAAHELGSLASSYSNLDKAKMIWNLNGRIADKYGSTVDVINSQTTVAQAFGLTPSALQEHWANREALSSIKNAKSKAKEYYYNAALDLLNANTEAGRTAAHSRITTILDAYFGDDSAARQDATQTFWNNFKSPTTEKEETIKRLLDELKGKSADDVEKYLKGTYLTTSEE